jgi:hypothetical protein
VDALAVLVRQFQRLLPVMSSKHKVTGPFERGARHVLDHHFVLGNEDHRLIWI